MEVYLCFPYMPSWCEKGQIYLDWYLDCEYLLHIWLHCRLRRMKLHPVLRYSCSVDSCCCLIWFFVLPYNKQVARYFCTGMGSLVQNV